MAIIKISGNQEEGTKGVEKMIDESAKNLIIDIAQKNQYSFPVESCTREVCSNSIDAIKEKIIARNILSGKNKISDYYLDRKDDLYKDSIFDKTYYDLKWFDESDTIRIDYIQNRGTGFCDSFIIQDKGVGISSHRFFKLLQLGFSTKRNTNQGLGGYGLGMKSPLSTDVDFFTIESCYNGKKIIANCYNYKTDFIIPKFNIELGLENKYDTIYYTNEGKQLETKIYFEDTLEKNYTKVTIPAKRYTKDKYIKAVENQLLYFDNIEFFVTDELGNIDERDFKANVIYNSKNILLADNNQYNQPHILVVKDEDSSECIAYGKINFKELEMEDLYTNCGIKCVIRSTYIDKETGKEIVLRPGISISPSRESVRFDENTRQYLFDKLKAVQEEATELIQKELVGKDFLEWIKTCQALIYTSYTGNDILNRLYKIIDRSQISPCYNNTEIKYTQTMEKLFPGFTVRKVYIERSYNKGKERKTLTRKDVEAASAINFDSVCLKTSIGPDAMKDHYIINVLAQGRFFIIFEELDNDPYLDNIKKGLKDKYDHDHNQLGLKESLTRDEELKLLANKKLVSELISKSNITSYESIIVPEDWKKDNKMDENNIVDDTVEIKQLTPAELRKLNEKIVYSIPTVREERWGDNIDIVLESRECKLSELKEKKGLIYYVVKDDYPDMKKAVTLSWNQHNNPKFPTFIKVSEPIAKKLVGLSNFKRIKNYFTDLNSDYIWTMDNTLIKWYTAKLIHDVQVKYLFLVKSSNYEQINKSIYDLAKELLAYSKKNYTDRDTLTEDTSLLTICDKVIKFQLFAQENPSEEDLKSKSMELFGSELVKNAHGVDMEIYNKLQILISYCEPIYGLFNQLAPLNGRNDYEYDNLWISGVEDLLKLKELFNFVYEDKTVKEEELETV